MSADQTVPERNCWQCDEPLPLSLDGGTRADQCNACGGDQ